jgi:hypothetical protein
VLKAFLKRIITRATLARKMATMGQLFYWSYTSVHT